MHYLGSPPLPPEIRRSLPTYSFERTSYWVRPERSVYVDADHDHHRGEVAPGAQAVTPDIGIGERKLDRNHSRLHRFGSSASCRGNTCVTQDLLEGGRRTTPSVAWRIYCFPFAGVAADKVQTSRRVLCYSKKHKLI